MKFIESRFAMHIDFTSVALPINRNWIPLLFVILLVICFEGSMHGLDARNVPVNDCIIEWLPLSVRYAYVPSCLMFILNMLPISKHHIMLGSVGI